MNEHIVGIPSAPLFSGLDHFLFNENSVRVWSALRDWLDAYFPAQ